MAISIIGLMTKSDPLEFIGRYVLESGQNLTNTLLSEYKKRFNDPEKFALYLLKYHWFSLSGSKFGSYMISVDLQTQKKGKHTAPIYLGTQVGNFLFPGIPVDYVDETLTDPNYIDIIYIISTPGKTLSLFIPNEDKTKWILNQTYSLEESVELVQSVNGTLSEILPALQIPTEEMSNRVDPHTNLSTQKE